MKLQLPSKIREDFLFYRSIYPEQVFFEVLLDRRFLVCACYRFGHHVAKVRTPLIGRFLRLLYVLGNLIISAISGADIRSGAIIGQRLDIHTTFGLLVADGVVIGNDCTLNSGVCLANKANGRGEGQPFVGDHVNFGVGSKVLGGITVGDHAVIGANAVVLHDVPAHHIAFGVPARNKPLATYQEAKSSSAARDVFGLKLGT